MHGVSNKWTTLSNKWTFSCLCYFVNLLIISDLLYLARMLIMLWHDIYAKMKRIIIIIVACQAVAIVHAQSRWTMERCMEYAVEHSTNVQRQGIEARQARDDYHAAMAGFLPKVQASVSGQYNWGRNIDPETNTYNNVATFNNYYEIYASLAVFDGFATVNAFRQARLTRQHMQTAMQKVQDDKAIDVMQKFVDAAYAQASISLAEEKLADSQQLLYKTQRMFELGGKSRPDVAQMESQVAEDDYNLTHQRNVSNQALLVLKTAINYPVDDSLRIDIKALNAEPRLAIDAVSNIYPVFLKMSPDVLTAEYNVENAHYNYIIQRAQMLPSLTLNGGVATNFYRNLSQGGGYEPFHTQFHNNQGKYLGLTLSIPLFVSSHWRSARQARAEWQKSLVSLDDARRKLHDDIAQAVMDRDGYVKELSHMQRRMTSDSLSYHLYRRKYEEGLLSAFDLHTSSQAYLQSRILLLQMQMMYVIKNKLVEYYKGEKLIK